MVKSGARAAFPDHRETIIGERDVLSLGDVLFPSTVRAKLMINQLGG